MTYFNFHPKTEYSINGINKVVIDIFRKIKLNITQPNTEIIGSKTFPETISYQNYQDEKLSWFQSIFG